MAVRYHLPDLISLMRHFGANPFLASIRTNLTPLDLLPSVLDKKMRQRLEEALTEECEEESTETFFRQFAFEADNEGTIIANDTLQSSSNVSEWIDMIKE